MNTTLETVSGSLLRSHSENVFWLDSLGHRKTLHQVSLKLRDLDENLSSSFLVLCDKLVFVVHSLLASVHTPHQVSVTLQDSEKNGSSSFLVQSDKLVLVLHFPLVPEFTVVKPASPVIARLRA